MKVTSVNIEDILLSNRYEPEYWIISHFLQSLFATHSYNYFEEYTKFIRKGIFDLKAERYKNEGVPFLRISNLKYFELDKTGMVYISESDNNANSKTILKEGDIAFSKIGTLGKVLRINDEYPCVNISQNLIGAGLKENIDKNYLFAFLLTKCALFQINRNRKKQLQDKLNLTDVKEIKVINIPDQDRQNISLKVNQITKGSISANQLLSKAQHLFYSRIGTDFQTVDKANTFSVNKSNFADADLWTPMYSYPLYVNTLKAIQGKWETVSVGEIADLKKGDEVGSDTYIGYLDKRKTDVPFVRTSDIVNYEIDQYPDFFIPEEIYKELNQGFQNGDVLFTKDGKIGMVGMITEYDKAIISSGFVGLRLNKKAIDYGITPEYLFLALSIKEIGIYASKRRTVVASTIPHLREERLKEIEIPILDKETISEITELVKQAFKLKDEKKRLIAEVRETMDGYFEV